MFWTGHQRDSSSVLTEQKTKHAQNIESLLTMREQAKRIAEATFQMATATSKRFGLILNDGWQLKRSLASTITNGQIDNWYQRGLDAGAIGGKLCGAGGGGFLLFIVPPERHQQVRQALPDLREVPVGPEVHGSQILLVD